MNKQPILSSVVMSFAAADYGVDAVIVATPVGFAASFTEDGATFSLGTYAVYDDAFDAVDAIIGFDDDTFAR